MIASLAGRLVGCRALSLADIAAKLQWLLERHSERSGETPLYVFHPEHQNVDALIGLAIAAQGTGYPA
jgi:hypothetical protein